MNNILLIYLIGGAIAWLHAEISSSFHGWREQPLMEIGSGFLYIVFYPVIDHMNSVEHMKKKIGMDEGPDLEDAMDELQESMKDMEDDNK